MLSSVFSAFSFLPLAEVMTSKNLSAFLEKLDKNTATASDGIEKKKLSLIKEWIKTGTHAQIE